jgi:DNA mismatch repair protein MutL
MSSVLTSGEPRIRRLPETVYRKIAAGEVVERPASVVKELVENSLDAGANRIAVTIAAGGKQLIQVTDNGCGMTPEEAILAFERHATSKISTEEDLQRISTLGFRGEGLASIANVSRCEIITRTRDSEAGFRLALLAGIADEAQECASAPGTSISVRDLFFNVPARLKFLKSDSSETAEIQETILRLALSHHHCSFRLIQNDRTLQDFPATQSFRDALARFCSPQEASQMVPVLSVHDDVKIEGFVSPPSLSRSSRSRQFFYVNNRFVVNRVLAQSLQAAYQEWEIRGRFPMAALRIDLPPDRVDVNVHPSKREIKFADEQQIKSLVFHAIKTALDEARPKTELHLSDLANPAVQLPLTSEQLGPDISAAQPHVLRPLAQAQNSWIVAEAPQGIVIIDQHAAHERVLFEQIRRSKRPKMPSQRLLEPIQLAFDREEADILNNEAELLCALGFELEPFGDGTFVLRAVPSPLQPKNAHTALSAIAAEILRLAALPQKPALDQSDAASLFRDKLATCACKLAVKLGDKLTGLEMQRLLDDLSITENAYTCPHGRPTMITITNQLLERRFKRKG